MTEHINGNLLIEDLRYRFNYVSKFVNFTNDDIQALNNLATVIIPLIPVIVDAVYRKLFQFDITKNFFVLHNDGFDGQLKANETLTLDSAQMTYRRDMLSGYLKRLLLQREWTDEFLRYLSRIGRMHTTSVKVDYIHINVTLCYIETQMIDAVWTTENIENKKEILLALNKVFRIQNDLFLLHYLQLSKETNTSIHHKTHKCTSS